MAVLDGRTWLESMPLRSWTLGSKPHWVRITPEEVSGRRIHKNEERVAEPW